MTDQAFQKLLDGLHRKHLAYELALRKAEAEYERRYGSNPSDAEDDMWIDCFHVAAAPRTVGQVEDGATNYAKLSRVNI